MTEAIIWLFLIELIGLAAWPLAFTVFQRLPERGFSLAKPLGLLAVSYLCWLISMLGVPFSSGLPWLVLLAGVVLLNGWLFLRNGRRLAGEMGHWLKQNVWLLVVMQLVFWLAYAYLVNLRSFIPDIRDQEKFGDYAFMLSMVISDKMPPADPWMSGYPINYYYFSHFMMALLTKMTGINPAIAFNLSVPLVFGLTALGSFGIVFNLIKLTRPATKNWRLAAFFGTLAFYMICLMGNLDSLRQIFFPRAKNYETGLTNFTFSWWTPSRVIYDYMPIPEGGGLNYQWIETINEFPSFSFLLADMHPHVMTLPFAILTVGLALAVWLTPLREVLLNFRSAETWLLLVVTSMAAGSLYFLNTWDYPTYTLLVAGVLLFKALTLDDLRFWRKLLQWVKWAGPFVVLSLALYLPFHLTFVSLIGDYTVPEPVASIPILGQLAKTISFVAWDRTPLLGYLLIFGGFALPLVTFLLLKVWPYFRQPYAYQISEPEQSETLRPNNIAYYLAFAGFGLLLASELGFYLLRLNPFLTTGLGILGAPLLGIGLGAITLEWLSNWRKERAVVSLQMTTLGLGALLIAEGWLLRFEMFGPLYICASLSLLLIIFETRAAQSPYEAKTDEIYENAPESTRFIQTADIFTLGLFLLPLLLTFGTELILIRDIFNNRMNTLFKFYYQAWIIYGLAAGYASWRIFVWAWKIAPFETKLEPAEDTYAVEETSDYLPQEASKQPQATLQLAPAGLVGQSNLAFSSGVSGASLAGSHLDSVTDSDLDDYEAEEAEEYAQQTGKFPWWRWLWAAAFGLLLLAGAIYPIFGPFEKTGRYANRTGLDGSLWMDRGGPTGAAMPQDYAAIQWLNKQIAGDKNFVGTILETTGPDWVDWSRVSAFTGMPTLLGWIGHEAQWRGGKAPARSDTFDCIRLMIKYRLRDASPDFDPTKPTPQKEEPGCRFALVDYLYNTPDAQQAEKILREIGVKYVYVGLLEQNLNSGRAPQPKIYAPEGLQKFSQFMTPIYQQDGVVIYGWK